ncbi:hypothetical protein [Leclercia adecarboxylata]|jgi:hypothetical protein|uniref:hypothetical protein n=1 Tax=Leclercia adecarboxylata TaxID=83655 RepID=UPI0012BB301B|nr:hypothetical protein [Leclercia adecarboxylata]MDU1654730.1 hypothetical protein [Leclercia adecarboxylata]QGP83639.1 hypothetical protein GLX29_10170 [Leclercia adecarboxylata]
MQQFDESQEVSRLHGKSAKEIVEIFETYNFVDDHGHRLDMCQDFIDLVKAATEVDKAIPKLTCWWA